MTTRGVLSLDQEVGASDAVLLDPLTEESFIANLHQRFKRDQIYTYIGNMLVSVNPFKKLALFTPEVISAYKQHNMLELPPHIYAIAGIAYRSMSDRNVDQCMVITGESGSGKTELGKLVLQYVSAVSEESYEVEFIKDHLWQSNYILEAFGNAKTHHNDNSSRFGKYLDIEFDFKGSPVGGIITNYFLEKSRVIRQSQGERNFHIFYQLLSGADVHLLKLLKLQRNADNYHFLRQSRCSQLENVDDKSNFTATKKAMEFVGFSGDEIITAFQIVSIVLKLGNVEFVPRSNMDGTEGCSLMNEYEIYDVCEMLHLDVEAFQAALTQRTVEANQELVVADLSSLEAMSARDALCKALYSRLFTWLVKRINETIRARRIGKRKSLGILDIYGFEVLENNSFEQFLINYFNEKVHQIFVEFTLKQEQEEYIHEGIQWQSVDYFNNSVICDLIEKNNHGILAMLNDECSHLNATSDEIFLSKLTKACQDNPYFESRGSHRATPSFPQHCFRLRHYAGSVTYTVTGFVDKNSDTLHKDVCQIMYRSGSELLKTLFPEGNPKRAGIKKPGTTASQFKVSVGALVKNLQAKNPNYVRCIKPNELKQPMIFEMALVQHQVRYLGLLESVRIRRAGFAHRQEYESFLQRYKVLSIHTWPSWSGPPLEGVLQLLKDLPIHPSEYACGRTKIFIKNIRTLFELEEFRKERLHELAALIQKTWRGWKHRQHFLRLRRSQCIISENYRAWKIREEQHGWREDKRREWAAKVICDYYYRWKRRKYLLWLSRNLPSESPLCREWPPSPRSLHETSHYLRKFYHKWRCHKYRSKFDQTARNRMREKVTASLIFKDRKASYAKSVSHPFRGDYVRLRHNVRWKRAATETGDQYVVFADIVNKITRASGKCIQTLFVVSTNAMLIMDQRTLQVKYRIPVGDIFRISLSPFMDDIAVFHVRTTEATRKKGDFLFETGHVIEIVTKLFLVIQNATGKPPEVNIATEFEANFGKENVLLVFRCMGLPEVQPGQVKISRKGNRMEIVL